MNLQLNEPGQKTSRLLLQIRQQFEEAKLEGPYFPLARFGDFWLAGKNKDGEKEFLMFESHSDLKNAEKELAGQGYTDIRTGRKLEDIRSADGLSEGLMADIHETLLRNGITPADPLMDEVYQAFLRAMPDLSMRVNFIHRKKTKGYSHDALRAFAQHSFHGSIQTARLRYSGKMQKLLKQMEETVRGKDDSAKSGALLNEVRKRHQWVMNPTNSRLSQKISSLGFAWYLGLSPASAAVNLTQNALVAMPVIGSQFGIGTAFTKMNKTLGEFMRARGDFNSGLRGHRLQAFKQMQASGAIDLSQAHNLAGLGDTDTLHYDPKTHRLMTGISWLFHKAEVLM